MTNLRLRKIYLTAGRLFDENSYANTKMVEIAKDSGIAVGTMYSAFTGKDAVLSFVIYATLDKDYLSKEITLPIKPIDPSILIMQLRKVFDMFEEAMNIMDKEGTICKDFPALIGDLFDLFADYLLALDNIEKNSGVLEELSQEYLPRKRAYFKELENILKLYMEKGQIRNIAYIPSHVLYLTNTLSWWALNSNLSFPKEQLPRNVAKEICVGMIQRSYQKN